MYVYLFEQWYWGDLIGLFSLLTSTGVILLRNPFKAIVSLNLTFLVVSGLCLILACEFLSLLLIFVYAGSISILFLFGAMFCDLWAFNRNKSLLFLCNASLLFLCMMPSCFLSDLYTQNNYYELQWLDLYATRSCHYNNISQIAD